MLVGSAPLVNGTARGTVKFKRGSYALTATYVPGASLFDSLVSGGPDQFIERAVLLGRLAEEGAVDLDTVRSAIAAVRSSGAMSHVH